jgi:RimJ/RimL family protein N-acetyltransferase
MKIAPVTVKLKNNKEITIREATPNDAQAFLETIMTCVKESEYLLTTFEEFDMTPEKEREWICSFMEKDNSLLLFAEYQGRIIGNIDLSGGHRKRIGHTALIGMSMLREWQHIGLGTALMQAAIDWAKRPGNPVELLWLMVIGANQNALALYNKMGFKESGRQKNYFRLDEKRYEDNIIMTMQL